MSSPRKWVLSVPDLTNVYSPKTVAPRDEYVFENDEFVLVLNRTYVHHNALMLSTTTGNATRQRIGNFCSIPEGDFTFLNIVVDLQTTSYQDVRASRTDLVEAVKLWAANVQIPRKTGTRLYALKRPVVGWRASVKHSGYILRFDIAVSNSVWYSKFRSCELNFDDNFAEFNNSLVDHINKVLPSYRINFKKVNFK